MVERVVLRVQNTLKIPGRDSVAATVEVLSGEPVVGCLLHHSGTAESWQIVGFGHAPVGPRPHRLYDLLLKPLGAIQPLPEGSLLSEQVPAPDAGPV